METTKKYELTEETIEHDGRTLYRIRALVDFGDVEAGELGSFIEKEDNLSHEGKCWVGGDAKVYGNAMVYGNAWVYGNAMVGGNSRVYDGSEVCDDARVYDNARVYGNAWVYGNARVYGDSWVCNNARVCDNAWICKPHHTLVVGTIGSRNDFTTFYRSKNGINVACGCFNGSLAEFLAKVGKKHKDNKHAKTYNLAAKLAEAQIERCE